MIYSKLVKLIEDNQAELTRRSLKELLGREETRCYRELQPELLNERVSDVYGRLISWLNRERRSGDIQKYYTELGKRRFHECIPLSEVVIAFMLLKRHLWLFVTEKQFFDSTYECYQALELNNKVVLFFDRVIYFATLGYEEEMLKNSQDKEGLFARLLKKK
ncbi:MAG TPA: hypothetical protein PKM41_12810 [Deltaproteobacteria bacterium]|nr:hypothetical protein [Deltaproteobacteria bacterium]HOI07912.1 hypothetical protein [Deltaproteobacteria bacterium]